MEGKLRASLLSQDGKRAFGNPPFGHGACLRNRRALTTGS